MTDKKFKPEDFASRHPGGSLGGQLLTRVKDLMHKKYPIIVPETPIKEVIHKITKGKLVLVMKDDNLIGIITDGDLRRALDKFSGNIFNLRLKI